MVWQCLAFKKIGGDVAGSFLANAPLILGERFDGGIAGFSDDMSFYAGNQARFDSNWVPYDSTNIRGDPTNNRINWIQQQDGTDDKIVFDLWRHGIYPSNSSWTLRFKWTISTLLATSGNNNFMMMGLTSSLSNPNTGDWIGLNWWGTTTAVDGKTFAILISGSDNAGIFPAQRQVFNKTLATLGSPPYTFYVEIKRTATTSIEATIYSDSNYSIPVEKRRVAILATVLDQRYIILSNQQVAGGTSTMTGQIDDVQFFNNTEGTTDQFVIHGQEDDEPFVPFVAGIPTKTWTGADDASWVIVDGFYSVVGGKVSGWGTEGGVPHRATFDMLGVSGITLDPNNWTFEFELKINSENVPAHYVFAVSDSASSIDPFPTAGPIRPSVALYVNRFGAVTDPLTASVVVTGSPFGILNVPTITLTTLSSPQAIPSLYARLQRINKTRFKLELFTDVARTIHFAGSPITVYADVDGPLNFIHATNLPSGGGARQVTGYIDTIRLYNGVSEANSLIYSEDFLDEGTFVQQDFEDLIPNSTGWQTTNSTRIRADNNLQNIYSNVLAEGANNAISKDVGTLVWTPPATTFTENFVYATQILADAKWVSSDFTNLAVNITPNEWLGRPVGDFILTNNAGNRTISYNLLANNSLTLDDNRWTLRTKARFSSFAGDVGEAIFGVSGGTGDWSAGVSAGIFFEIITTAGTQSVSLGYTNGLGRVILGSLAINFQTATDYYFQLTRDTSTRVTLEVFSDSTFRTMLGAFSGTIPALTGLQYIKVGNVPTSINSGTVQGRFDEINIWNAIQPTIGMPTLPTLTFSDDFTYATQTLADASWVSTDVTRARANITTDLLDFNFNIASTNVAISHDLGSGNVSNNNWILDATIRFSTITPDTNTRLYVGLSSNDHTIAINGSADRIFAMIRTSTGFKDFNSMDTDGTGETGADNTVSFIFVTGVDYFLRIVRDTATTYHVEFFSDANRTVSLGRANGTCPATVNNLRYIVVQNVNAVNNTVLTGTIGNVRFSNQPTDDNWLFRTQMNILSKNDGGNGIDKAIYMGLFDKDHTHGTAVAQSGLYVYLVHDNVNPGSARLIHAVNVAPNTPSSDLSLVRQFGLERLFLEFGRDGPNSAHIAWYADEDYSLLIEKLTFTNGGTAPALSGVTGLRWLKMMNDQSAVGAGSYEVTYDDLKFWNGRNKSCNPLLETVNFFDDFSTYANQGSADASWVPNDSAKNRVNITSDKLDFNLVLDSTNDAIAHDLGAGNVSNTDWTLRFKLHVSSIIRTISNIFWFGIFDQNQTAGGSALQDGVVVGIQQSSLFSRVGPMSVDNTAIGSQAFLSFQDAFTLDNPYQFYFVELRRINTTSAKVTFYTDPLYTNKVFSTTGTIVGNPTSLRYIKLVNADGATQTGNFIGTIDDVYFWNNQAGTAWQNDWISNDESRVYVDPCQHNIVYAVTNTSPSAFYSIYHDLGTILSTSKFVARFKVNFSDVFSAVSGQPNGDDLRIFIQSTTDASHSAPTDALGVIWRVDHQAGGSPELFQASNVNNGVEVVSNFAFGAVSGNILYFELIRLSPTSFQVNIFTDPDYTFLRGSVTQTIANTIQNLRYIMISKFDGGASTNRNGGTIDDIQVWDGVDVADSLPLTRYIEAFSHYQPVGGVIRGLMDFNLDQANNYAQRFSTNGGADPAPSVNQSALFGQNYNEVFFQRYDILSEINIEKMVFWSEMSSPLGFTAPQRVETVGKWSNPTTPISRFLIRNDQAGDFANDTEFLVFGDV